MTESRVALVTGGAYGIGRATVQQFAKKGEATVIADRDAERGAALESSLRNSGCQTLFVPTDIRVERSERRVTRGPGPGGPMRLTRSHTPLQEARGSLLAGAGLPIQCPEHPRVSLW